MAGEKRVSRKAEKNDEYCKTVCRIAGEFLAVGDYIAGPSHVLPTGGTGRFFNGLTMDAFYRRTSLIHYEQDALMRELPDIEVIASCEGLDAHRRSASIRRDGV